MFKKWFKEYFETYKRDIILIISLILLGIIIGIGAFVFSSDEIKTLATTTAKEVFDISKSETYVKTNVILNGIKADVILISILAVFSVSLFGNYIIYLFMILKGAALSFYSILLFNIFGPLWGVCVVILLVVLVNIIYLPALIYLVINLLEVNFSIFKARLSNVNITGLYKMLIIVITSFMIMFSSIVVEQIASSVVLKIYSKL